MSERADERAGEELLTHSGFLRELARGLVRDAGTAEDLVQETFAAALERRPGPGSLRAWLATVLRHRASNARRELRRREGREERAARAEAEEPADEVLARLELARRLAACVLLLREPYRTAIYLRYHEGLAPRAIAARLRLPVKTVKTRLARALAELRRELDAGGEGRERWLAGLVGLAFPSALPAGAGAVLVGSIAGGLVVKKLALASLLVLVAALLAWLGPRLVGRGPRALDGGGGSVPALHALPGIVSEPAAAAAPASAPREALPAPAARVGASGTLLVRVQRERDGAPLRGLCVDLLALDDPALRRERLHLRSDALGIARFEAVPAGRARVFAATGSAADALVVAGETRELVLVQRSGLDVAGRVVDPAGLSVAGAEVWIESHGNPLASHRAELSGADGRFVLSGLEEHIAIGARAAGWQPSERFECGELPVGASGARELLLELRPAGARLAGRVLDASGAPVVGAQVLAGPEGGAQRDLANGLRAYAPGRVLLTTDERGEFAQPGDLAPGPCELFVCAGGAPVWTGAVELLAGERNWVEVVLEGAFRVRGRVLDAEGRPVAGAEVSASRERGVEDLRDPFPAPRARCDESGLFQLDLLPPGELELRAAVPGRDRLGRARASVTGVSGASLEVELVLDPGPCIAGRVLDRAGRPLAGWGVHADSQWFVEDRAAGMLRGQRLQRTDRSDERGEFLIANLEPHPVDLAVAAPGQWPHPPRATARGVRPGTRGLVLVVEDASLARARIAGRLLDARGRAPQDVKLTLWDAAGSAGSFVAFDRTSGDFEHEVQLPGSYTLRVLRGGNELLVSGPYELVAGESRPVGTLLLGEPGRVEVELVGPADPEREGVELLLTRADAADESLEREGALHRSRPLAAGAWTLQLRAKTWFAPDRELLVREGETERLRLELAPALPVDLGFELADPSAAWSSVVVELRDGEGSLVRRHGPWLRHHVQGELLRIHRLGLPAGHYTVEARTDAGQEGRGSFTITDAASARGPHRFGLR